MFHFGKYNRLPKVNLWPRPVQEPHPPVLIPGTASSSTWNYCHDRDFPYACLSYFGGKSAEQVMDRFWARAAAKAGRPIPTAPRFSRSSGPPLVYLHAADGPIRDPFVDGPCERYTVHAPHHPAIY